MGYICDSTNTGKILTNVSRKPHGFEIIWTTHECQMTGTQLGMKGVQAAPRKSSVFRSITTVWHWVWPRTCTTTVMSTHYNTRSWLSEEWEKDKGDKLTSWGPASFLSTRKSGQDFRVCGPHPLFTRPSTLLTVMEPGLQTITMIVNRDPLSLMIKKHGHNLISRVIIWHMALHLL